MNHNRSQETTGRTRRAVARIALGVFVAATAAGGLAPAVEALPSSGSYDYFEPAPRDTYPRADLVVGVQFAAVYNGTTGAWEGYQTVATVRNQGDKRAGAFDLRVRADERNEQGWYQTRTYVHRVAVLDPGKSVTIKSVYIRKPCWMKVVATADSGNVVQESNEANNVTQVEWKRCNW